MSSTPTPSESDIAPNSQQSPRTCTPSPAPNPALLTTPAKAKLASDPHSAQSTIGTENSDKHRLLLAGDMDKRSQDMEVESFFDNFVPGDDPTPEERAQFLVFEEDDFKKKEKEMAAALVSIYYALDHI